MLHTMQIIACCKLLVVLVVLVVLAVLAVLAVLVVLAVLAAPLFECASIAMS